MTRRPAPPPRLDPAGLRLALQGLWFRRSTALIVLALTSVATTAAVLAPLYSRAAEESILRDTLSRADDFALALHVAVPQSGAGAGLAEARDGRFTATLAARTLSHPAFGRPRLAYAGSGVYRPTRGDLAGGEVVAQVVERPDLCAHLPVLEGRCPTAVDEVVLTRRSLAATGTALGDTVEVELPESASLDTGGVPPLLRLQVVGAVDPVPVDGPYWSGRPYFSSFYPQYSPNGLGENPPTVDPFFVGTDTASAAGLTTYTVDVPVRPGRVRLDDIAALRREARQLDLVASAFLLSTESQLPAALQRADEGRDLVRVAAPLAVAQLVLLSWWTLFLVVSAATEERSPEVGLAKLRGLTGAQTRRFSLAEVVLLLLLAAPVGTAAGYLAVRLAAERVFAPGTEVVLTWSVLLTLLGAIAGGVATAVLASRRVVRGPVVDLLRRVPPRRGARRRARLLEVSVVVLAGLGLAQVAADRGGRPSPVAIVAPGMVAVAGGLLAARLLVHVARRRAHRAGERGRAPALAGWAAVARRPGTARVAAVLAVACSLLLVGVQAWAVGERNRHERAAAETGAAVVLTVRAADPHRLLTAVRDADPRGSFAMAAVTVLTSTQEPALLAVDSAAADQVLRWGAPDAVPGSRVRRALHPALPPPLVVRPGPISVTAELREVDSPSPLSLSLRLARDGATTRLDLGEMRRGRHTYDGTVPPGCAKGCRLAAIGITHPGTDIENAEARLRIQAVHATTSAGPGDLLATDFAVPGSWRASAPSIGGPEVRLRHGPALDLWLRTPGGPYAEAVRADSPEPLPAVVGANAAGPPPAHGGVPVSETRGLTGGSTRFYSAQRVGGVPRLGPSAVAVDLELALRLDENAPLGDRQVWLARDDRTAEHRLVAALERSDVVVLKRETLGALERAYAGDGAVLALRLLLVCGAAAVAVSVGALLVAAYVDRRARAYEVAALRVVGVRRRAVLAILLRENLATVLVALGSGALAAALTTWVVMPSLPQFDTQSETVPVRFGPDVAAAGASLGGLAALLAAVGLLVAGVQLRNGRADRLREGVR